MNVKLTFHGPNTSVEHHPGDGMGTLGIKESVVVLIPLLDHMTLADSKRFWDLEHAINDLTKGRVHVSIEE